MERPPTLASSGGVAVGRKCDLLVWRSARCQLARAMMEALGIVKSWRATIAVSVMLTAFASPGQPRAASVSPSTTDRAPLLASSPGQTLSFTIGDRVRVANVTREGLSADDVSLRRFPGHMQGEVGVEPVDFRLEPKRLEGRIGTHPIALDVVRSTDGLEVMGTFGQRAVAMEVRLSGIDAQVGPCWYSLRLVMGSYRGYVTCGAQAEPVMLTVPVALVARDDLEIAAMLTALFAR